MEKENNINGEIVENEEVKEIALSENKKGNIMSFEEMRNNSDTISEIYTNIKDKKKLFNIQNKVDNLLNDCENKLIRVKGILIKIFRKPLKNPIIDEETGEVLKDIETSMSCVLVDNNGISYATGSKMFSIQLIRYIQDFGMEDFEKGLEIKIVKNKMNEGKALGFELV